MNRGYDPGLSDRTSEIRRPPNTMEMAMQHESLVWLIEADHRREEARLARARAFALGRAAKPGSRS
ncbi:MAG: hypothetical protein ACRDGL_03010, partial [Candidatus Limnocylindrales bacterium]